jgi:hypothetical protein
MTGPAPIRLWMRRPADLRVCMGEAEGTIGLEFYRPDMEGSPIWSVDLSVEDTVLLIDRLVHEVSARGNRPESGGPLISTL